jgi:predicted transcriptional regulator of viral defense system
MKWKTLLDTVGEEPLFHASLLQTGSIPVARLRLQLSRWVAAGRLLQLRRGVYTIAAPYRKVDPHPFLIANVLRKNSYVSLQSALAHHGLIPEHVPVVTSVTTARPEHLRTPMGSYLFKHVKMAFFFGYRQVNVARLQQARVATPEKALLDLVYLTPGAASPAYLQELRLQNLEVFDPERLTAMASRMGKPKIALAARRIIELVAAEREEIL